MLILIGAYALFATTFNLGEYVVQYGQPIFAIAFRMIMAGLLLLGYQYFFNRSALRLRAKDWMLFAQAALFHIFISYTTEFHAMQTVSGAKVALIYNMSPFVAALLSYFALKEKLNMRKWIGLIIGFVGFIPLLWVQNSSGVATSFWGGVSFAEAELILSVVSASYGWVVVKQLMNRNYSIITVNGIAMLGGGLLALGSSFMFETWAPMPVISFWPFFWGILLLVIIGNVICFNIFGSLLRTYSATFMTFVGFITPLFTAFYAWILWGKTVNPSFFMTLAMVSVGLYIFYLEELRHIRLQNQ